MFAPLNIRENNMIRFITELKEFLMNLDEYDKKNIATFLATTAGIIVILCFIRDILQQYY